MDGVLTIRVLGLLAAGLALSGCTGNRTPFDSGVLDAELIAQMAGSAKNRGQNGPRGAVEGGLIGYAVGHGMDPQDQQQAGQVYEEAADHQSVSWFNSDTGYQYTVTPRSTLHTGSGQPCRQAEIEAVLDGRRETMVKMACRRPDGRWAF